MAAKQLPSFWRAQLASSFHVLPSTWRGQRLWCSDYFLAVIFCDAVVLSSSRCFHLDASSVSLFCVSGFCLPSVLIVLVRVFGWVSRREGGVCVCVCKTWEVFNFKAVKHFVNSMRVLQRRTESWHWIQDSLFTLHPCKRELHVQRFLSCCSSSGVSSETDCFPLFLVSTN